MLLNLFDAHEHCCVFPTDISVLYGYFPPYCEQSFSREACLERLDLVIFKTLERLRERHDLEAQFPVETMREHFFDHIDPACLDSIDLVIRQLVASFRSTSGLSVAARPVVVLKETSLEIYAAQLAELFPEARILQLVRDPRDNYAALRAGIGKHYSLFGEGDRHILASLLHRVGIGMGLIQPNRELLGNRFDCIRFEDLTSRPTEVIRNIAKFANIENTSQLYCPTVMGNATRGNNYDDQSFFEISSANVGRWQERISDEEAAIIEFHLGDIMLAHGYELVFDREKRARAAAEFYKWANYRYFFKDSFTAL